MSAVDLLQPPPAPNHGHKSVRPRKMYGIHWFRLVVIALILIRVLVSLPGLAWPRIAALWNPAARPGER